MIEKVLNPEYFKATHIMFWHTPEGLMSHNPNEFGDGGLDCMCPHCNPKGYEDRDLGFKTEWGINNEGKL